MKEVQLIEKEQVGNLKFPDTDVLTTADEKQQLQKTLDKALALGNLDKVKVQIIFEDKEGLKRVDTTVWGITEKNILLKGDRRIPIKRIHSIEFV